MFKFCWETHYEIAAVGQQIGAVLVVLVIVNGENYCL